MAVYTRGCASSRQALRRIACRCTSEDGGRSWVEQNSKSRGGEVTSWGRSASLSSSGLSRHWLLDARRQANLATSGDQKIEASGGTNRCRPARPLSLISIAELLLWAAAFYWHIATLPLAQSAPAYGNGVPAVKVVQGRRSHAFPQDSSPAYNLHTTAVNKEG